jgi:hypothetical protein
VGIGTASPAVPLSLQGSIANSMIHVRNDSTSGYSAMDFLNSSGTPSAAFGYGNSGVGNYPNQAYAGSTGALPFNLITSALSRVYITATGEVGIGNTAPADKLQVSGEVRVLNCVRNAVATQIAGTCPSDARLKRDIRPGTLLGRVAALEPVRFHWRAEEFPEMQYGTKEVRGLIAQQVEQLLPELVETAPSGYKAVNYSDLPLYLLQAVKELKVENDALREQLASKADAQRTEISELREMLMSLQRQLGMQVSKVQ